MIAEECSQWQESLPSLVTTVQLSDCTTVSGLPTLTIGSTARHIPFFNCIPAHRLAEIRHLRVFVDLAPDAVPDILGDNAVALAIHIIVDCIGDIIEVVAQPHLVNADKGGLAGHIYELLGFFADFADPESGRSITVPALVGRAHVQGDNVAFLQDPPAWNAVDHFFV